MSCAAAAGRSYYSQPGSSEGRQSCFRPHGREVRSMRSSSPAPPAPATGSAPPSPGSAPRSPIARWLRFLIFPALLLINFVVIQQMTPAQPQRVEVSYTFFKQQVEADNVAQISTRTDTIQGTFKQAVTYQPDPALAARTASDFSTVIPAFADPGLETLLAAHGGIINARPLDQPSNPFITILLGFGPTLLLIGGLLCPSRKSAGQKGVGIFSFCQSPAKRCHHTTVGDRGVTFADV